MLDAIAIYSGILKPATLKTLAEIENTFEYLQYTDHELDVAEPEMLNDDMAPMDKGEIMMAAYERHVDSILILFGVFLMDDGERVTLDFKSRLLAALSSMDKEDNRDVIANVTAMTSVEDLDMLISILTEMMSETQNYLEQRIGDVDPALMDRVRKSLADPEVFHDVIERQVEIKQALLGFLEDRQGFIYDKVVKSNTLPLSWHVAFGTFKENAPKVPATQAATEAIAACIAAGFTGDEVETNARQLIEESLGDSDLYIAVSAALDRALSEVPA